MNRPSELYDSKMAVKPSAEVPGAVQVLVEHLERAMAAEARHLELGAQIERMNEESKVAVAEAIEHWNAVHDIFVALIGEAWSAKQSTLSRWLDGVRESAVERRY